MRISGWHIAGFGIFHDYEVRGLPSGLSVVLGPNEAGKSTLLAFIFQILFGFPAEGSPDRRYPPLRGGTHGGRLFLADPDGDYVVQRLGGPEAEAVVTLPNGRLAGEEELQRLLGDGDRRLFQTAFAFSLAELQDFATLDDRYLRERIFSAGIVGAGRSAGDALQALAERQTALLGPRGDGRIHALRARLADVDRRLADARRTIAGYPEIVAEERAAASEVQRLAAAIEEWRAVRERAARLIELWPRWVGRRDAGEELAALEVVETVPERGAARLAELQAGLDLTARRAAAAERELADVEHRLAARQPDERLASLADEIGQLPVAVPLYRERIVALPAALDRRRQAERALEDRLRDLGPHWDRARLAGFDRSVPARAAVRVLAAALARATGAVEQAAAAAERAEVEWARRDIECTHAADALAALAEPDLPLETLAAREAAVGRLRVDLAERAAVRARLEWGEEALRQLEALRDNPLDPGASARWSAIILSALAVLLAAAAAAVGLLVMAIAGAGLGASAAVVVVGAVWLWRVARRATRAAAAARARFSAEYDRAAAALEALHVTLAQLEGTIADDAALLHLAAAPTAAALAAAAAALEAARRNEEERAATLRGVAAAEERLAGAMTARARARQEADRARLQLAARSDEWAAWRREHGAPDSLSPPDALDFFDAVRLAREALLMVETAERDLRQLVLFVHGFEDRANRALAGLGEPADLRGLDLLGAVERLQARAERDRALRRERATLQETAAGLRRERDRAREEAATLACRRDALFAAAGATDADGFHRRLAAFARRRELDHVVRDADRELEARLGAGPGAARAREELAIGNVDGWRCRADMAAREAAALDQERTRVVTARAQAQAARRRLEESPAIPELSLERAGVVDALEEAARRWRVASLAGTLIHDALARFERERQPAVLAEASRLFTTVTGGRYGGVWQREGELIVVGADGAVRGPDSLSRSTAGLLYLCVRLGLVAELARRGMALPLVMDDVLVNFDPARAAALARALADVARRHQILVFTCHPETAEALRAAAPGCGLYHLGPGGAPLDRPAAPA